MLETITSPSMKPMTSMLLVNRFRLVNTHKFIMNFLMFVVWHIRLISSVKLTGKYLNISNSIINFLVFDVLIFLDSFGGEFSLFTNTTGIFTGTERKTSPPLNDTNDPEKSIIHCCNVCNKITAMNKLAGLGFVLNYTL